MHNHGLVRPEAWEQEFGEVLRASRDGGVRVALAPSLSTEIVFTYGEDEAFLASVSPDLRAVCERILQEFGLFGKKEYFAAVHGLHRAHHGPKVRIMRGPMSPQWVRDEAFKQIRRDADELGLRIHTHVQQTQLQRLYGFKR
jgi:cytosine/adenosine deaminase-related metal-dependent hydrolase